MLRRDNVVAPGADGLAALGIAPTPLDAVAPGWLVRYRRTRPLRRHAPPPDQSRRRRLDARPRAAVTGDAPWTT